MIRMAKLFKLKKRFFQIFHYLYFEKFVKLKMLFSPWIHIKVTCNLVEWQRAFFLYQNEELEKKNFKQFFYFDNFVFEIH